LSPLKPATSYLVVLTTAIEDLQGDPLQPSFTYELLKGDVPLTDPTANALQQIVASHTQVLSAQLGIEADTVALSWVFTTQSTRDVLQAVKDNTAAGNLILSPVPGLSTDNENIGGLGFADVYVGSLTLPYYLTAVDSDNDAAAALASFWTNTEGNVPGALDAQGMRDFTPVASSEVTVPVLMTIPNSTSNGGGTKPESGWPVTIFQHGITGNRSNMFGIADSMAQANRAVIAIDIPLHGLTDESNALHAANSPLVENERTFDLDVSTTDPDTGFTTPVPDGVTDPSGTHFIRLNNLANTRDNLRQAVADLFTLRASLAVPMVESPAPFFDTNDLSFVGHSLGAIVGTTMLSYDNTFHSATLGMPGGGISQLLANSERFGPSIDQGLLAAGIETDSSEYFQFLNAAQAMIDSGDPINHANILANNEIPRIHFIEVIGDTVVPNSVPTGPLSGSEPLISELRLQAANETVMGRSAVVSFLVGDHGALLRPTEENPEATLEMQMQMAGFAASRGMSLPIQQPDLLQEPQ
jgi:pimeloyl-ACP methyl ester carboxylesterase